MKRLYRKVKDYMSLFSGQNNHIVYFKDNGRKLTCKRALMSMAIITVFSLALMFSLPGTAWAGTNTYTSITDNPSPPLTADGSLQLIGDVQGSKSQGGATVTTISITVNGTVTGGDVTEVSVYGDGCGGATLCGATTGSFGNGSNVDITSVCGKPTFPYQMCVRLNSSAGGKTVGITHVTDNTAGTSGTPSSSNLSIAAANNNPDDPTGLAQFRNDGTTSIASGGYTEESQVKLEADIQDTLDSGDTLQLHIDLNNDGTADCSSAAGLANPSTNVQVTCTVTNPNSYDWRAQTEDNNGGTSAWVAFAGTPDFTVDQDAPATPNIQVGAQTSTSCDLSWSATDSGSGLHSTPYKVVYQAGASPPSNTDCTNGTVWQDWTASASGTHSPLSPSTQYSYRACFRDAVTNPNISTATTSCTTDAAPNNNPDDPTGLAQFRNDGTTSIASGGYTEESQVKLEADIQDTLDSGDTLQLHIDLNNDGTADCSSSAGLANPSTNVQVTCTVTNPNSYDWRAQTEDNNGGTSNWVAFAGTPDFTVDQDGPASPNIQVDAQTTTSCDLSWSATDGGSGLHGTPYKVVYQAGATPPTNTDCTNGTLLLDWTATASTTHSPLSPSSQYSYRACFRDALSNTSTATTSCTTDGQELSAWLDESSDTLAPGATDIRMAKITTTATGTGASLTETQVQVDSPGAGGLASNELGDITIYWNTSDDFGTATQVGVQTATNVGTAYNITLTGVGGSNGFIYYTIDISGGDIGDTYTLTVNSVTGSTSDVITLPQTTAQKQIIGATTTVGDGTSPSSKSVNPSDTNQAVSAFTLETNTGTDTVTQIVVTGTNTANVATGGTPAGVEIWLDNGDSECCTGDTSQGSADFVGATATISVSITATTTPTDYIITYDIDAGATPSATMTGVVTSISATHRCRRGLTP
jgi:hypothetical protein